MTRNNRFSDEELIDRLRNGSTAEQAEAFELIYLNHKEYCIGFMRSKFGQREGIKDLYHDALIILREKAIKPGWQLTCKIRTYLVSVSYNQCKTKFGNPKKPLLPEDEIIPITDWLLPMEESLNEERIRIIKSILNDEEKTTPVCYEILTRSLYQKQSPEQIAKHLGYKNSDVVKNQKSRCLLTLKKEVLKKTNGN